MTRLFTLLLAVFLYGCGSVGGPAVVTPVTYNIDSALDAEKGARPRVQGGEDNGAVESMQALISPYRAKLDETMNRELATLATPLKKGAPESTMGNWMADLMLAAARDLRPDLPVLFATANSGGLRVQEINAGPLLVSEIYEMMPFDNELVFVELTGKEVSRFVRHIADSGGWPISAGTRVVADADGMTIRVNDAFISESTKYWIALPDYVANGGSDSDMLVGKRQVSTGKLIRDLLIEYAAKAEGPIRVNGKEGRIRLE